jgi:DNA-binding response OmpR family regulator
MQGGVREVSLSVVLLIPRYAAVEAYRGAQVFWGLGNFVLPTPPRRASGPGWRRCWLPPRAISEGASCRPSSSRPVTRPHRLSPIIVLGMTAPTVLLVDDDSRLREIVGMALEGEGYAVRTTDSAEEAVKVLEKIEPDLLILDVMLPGNDGFELCREIRTRSPVPILMLTAKTDTIDIVVGLESGADDYVTKPFVTKELVARIRALLRRSRSQGKAPRKIAVGDLEIDPAAATVTKAGAPIHLTKTEFKLLLTLASRPNQVFTREVILQQVWEYDYFGDSRLVDVHIRRLRAKIEDDPRDPRIVQTVRGLGYKVAA